MPIAPIAPAGYSTYSWYAPDCYGPTVQCWATNMTGSYGDNITGANFFQGGSTVCGTGYSGCSHYPGDTVVTIGQVPKLAVHDPYGNVATGFLPPTPYSSYQFSDTSYGNVVQNNNYTWGFYTTANSTCQQTNSTSCGLVHWTNLPGGLYPWNATYFPGNPTLDIETQAQLGEYTGGTAGAWQFICVMLQDTSAQPYELFEWCAGPWNTEGPSNTPTGWYCQNDSSYGYIHECVQPIPAAYPGNNPYAVRTFFAPGTQLAANLTSTNSEFVSPVDPGVVTPSDYSMHTYGLQITAGVPAGR